MPMTMNTTGMEYFSDLISALGDKAEFVATQALYEGAGIMADEVNKAAKEIKTAPFKWAREGEKRLPSPEEKAMVVANGAMGIASFDIDGSEVKTSVGYNGAGYAKVPWNHMRSNVRTNYKLADFKGRSVNASSTLKYFRLAGGGNLGKGAQNMKPIGVIANSINSGTSFMEKQPFFRRAVTRGTKKAKAAIIQAAEQMFDYIANEQQAGGKTA